MNPIDLLAKARDAKDYRSRNWLAWVVFSSVVLHSFYGGPTINSTWAIILWSSVTAVYLLAQTAEDIFQWRARSDVASEIVSNGEGEAKVKGLSAAKDSG